MRCAAVLGAGYMGSAITFPLAENGLRVHLWGTWLDDGLLDATRHGSHPRLRKPLPRGVSLFHAAQLSEAVGEADILLIAVTSEGFVPVFRKLLQALDRLPPLFVFTKGFVQLGERVLRISDAAVQLLMERSGDPTPLQWVSVGGPVKAVELSSRIPTATVFGYQDPEAEPHFASFATSYYRVFPVRDVIGVELSSALKNVYAIGMGICDGLYEAADVSFYHNFKAFLFNQALREMARIVGGHQGKRETVFDLAGIGDLYVTSASGRNGLFGRRIGSGGDPAHEYEKMHRAGEVAEGYHTLELLMGFLRREGAEGLEELPLLSAINRTVLGGGNPRDELEGLVGKVKRAG
jgi:glycerol-3-phosphate dehydrogenase (NAD(P)+)